MNSPQQSVWQKVARLRWPAATITGDGPLALVCPITASVALYDWPMQAMADMSVNHSNFQCVSAHQLVALQTEPAVQPVRNMADQFPD
jgi:hypothetical protein